MKIVVIAGPYNNKWFQCLCLSSDRGGFTGTILAFFIKVYGTYIKLVQINLNTQLRGITKDGFWRKATVPVSLAPSVGPPHSAPSLIPCRLIGGIYMPNHILSTHLLRVSKLLQPLRPNQVQLSNSSECSPAFCSCATVNETTDDEPDMSVVC